MLMFIGILSFVGMIVFLILSIIAKFKKAGKAKRRLLYALGCLIIMFIAAGMDGSNSTSTASAPIQGKKVDTNKSSDAVKQKTTDAAKKKDDQAQAEAKKKAEEAAARKKADEEAAKKKAEQEAAAKKKADEDAKAQAAAQKAAQEKATQIQPGTYQVGTDIQPGLYKTDGDISYFARLKGLSGDLTDILANGNPVGPDIIQILPTDKGFQTQGSGFWYKIDDSYKPEIQTSFGDGTYIVGKDISPGTYKSSGGDMGYWARLSGFTGDLSEVLANANPQGPTIVEIKPTDKGFQTSGNGTWTKVQ